MQVKQIPGEPTRYWVESSSLECRACKKSFSRRELKHGDLEVGSPCPSCGQSNLEEKWHIVDLAGFRPIGQCSCEHFVFRLQANLSKIPPNQLHTLSKGEAAKLRCSHIEAARSQALDVTVEQHVRQQEKRHYSPGSRSGIGA